MGLNVGAYTSGRTDSFQKFSLSRFAYRHLFVIENKIEGTDLPSLFVLRGMFPMNEFASLSVERGNANTHYPDIQDIGDLDIEFYETMDNVVYDFFDNWNSRVYAKNTLNDVVYNVPSAYKRSIYVFRLDTMPKEGETDFSRVFGMEYAGCWPRKISDLTFDQSEAGVVNMSVTFSVDRAIRLKSGHGITTPEMVNREQIKMGSNPVEGLTRPLPSREQEVQTAEQEWRKLELELERKGIADRNRNIIERETIDRGLWVKALLTAAARTGINIALREAYYMAHAAAESVGSPNAASRISGGVRQGTNFIRTL